MSSFTAMDAVFQAVLAGLPTELRDALVLAELSSPSVFDGVSAKHPFATGAAELYVGAFGKDSAFRPRDLHRLTRRCSIPPMVPIASSLSSSPPFSVFPSPSLPSSSLSAQGNCEQEPEPVRKNPQESRRKVKQEVVFPVDSSKAHFRTHRCTNRRFSTASDSTTNRRTDRRSGRAPDLRVQACFHPLSSSWYFVHL